MDRPPLLFLCHRIPYPPNKGDKIRSFHLLAFLARHYRIFLGSFVDDPEDWQYRGKLESLCEQVHLVDLNPRLARLRSLTGLLSGSPLSCVYYRSRSLDRWVDRVIDEFSIDKAIVYSSAMAQFLMDDRGRLRRKVIDFVDVDSDKWRQYAETHPGPLRWIYAREAKRLLEFDREVALRFDASLFVCEAEAALFRRLVPEAKDRIGHYDNGVDLDYFSPAGEFPNPFPGNSKALVFTGAMDYWPNEDAVTWFSEEVFPQLRTSAPDLAFYIVGSRPTERVRKLAEREGVIVTGRVADVRPYLKHALAAVAPMRVARGIQNKVLEGMAMQRPVIVSPEGLEGIEATDGREVLLAREPADYVRHVKTLLAGEYPEIGATARALVVSRFDWSQTLPRVEQVLEGASPAEAGHA